MRVVLTGGGSGGHVTPFGPIVESLRTVHSEQKQTLPKRVEPQKLEITFIGIVDEQAKHLFSSLDVPTINVPSGKLRRYISGLTPVDILVRLPVGIINAIIHMWRIMPDVVISKGGYGSIPTILAGWFYRIPSIEHESDAVMGMTNTRLARFVSAIAVGFPNSEYYRKEFAYKIIATGTPVQRRLETLSQEDGKSMFSIPNEEFVLLVMGGSQGAQQINEAILSILPDIIINAAIIHITGEQHFKAVSSIALEILEQSHRKTFYKVFPTLSDDKMPYALAAADAVVSRAGATSLAEIARRRTPALIIPLDGSANDHQRKNAEVFESTGGILVLDPTNMGRHIFKLNIDRLLTDAELRNKLSTNIQALDHPNASRDIATFALKLATGYEPKKPETSDEKK